MPDAMTRKTTSTDATHHCQVGPIRIEGGNPAAPLTVIAGPCAIEDDATNEAIIRMLTETCGELGMPLVFKGSFDKANRSSISSRRGPGLEEGCKTLADLGRAFGVPVTTDVHEPDHPERVAKYVDMLQIPAFLCRQTDLLVASAKTGLPVNVKKGQFVSPSEMRHAIEKVSASGNDQIMLTERGTFFGYHRLVNDFTGLGDLMDFGRPVCFDVTHSTQLPGADAKSTGGRPERAALLARAAVAAGVDVVFIECHPDPANAVSDGATQQPLAVVPGLLKSLRDLRRVYGEAVVR